MSEMSSILRIHLDRDAFSPNEPNERGTAARDAPVPESCSPFNSGSLREESEAARRDAQYAAHAAHAVDPSVLDAYTPFWMRTLRSDSFAARCTRPKP